MEDIVLYTSWDDIVCPICLDFPHNCVLLQCSSYGTGCRPFVCDTNHLQSNCLDRFKEANGMSPGSQSPSSALSLQLLDSVPGGTPLCPLCRGEVTGWIVADKARIHLDVKNRACEEEKCRFSGTYFELQKHAQVEHPHACPSKIDPARQLDWENFQQSSEIIDVLSTIHSEVPNGVVLGDYVIEYGGENSGEDLDNLRDRVGNWWTSCILYKVLKTFRRSRNKRRPRVSNSTRGNHHLTYDSSNSDEGSVSSLGHADYIAEVDGGSTSRLARELLSRRAGYQSNQNRPSRFFDN